MLAPAYIAKATAMVRNVAQSAEISRKSTAIDDKIEMCKMWIQRIADDCEREKRTATPAEAEYVDRMNVEIQTALAEKNALPYLPTVRKCISDLGLVPTTAMVKLQLVKLNFMLNMARPLSDDMIEIYAPLIVDRIVEEDVSLNLADLRIIFDNAAMGRYGKVFGGLGLNDIISWIDQYVSDKMEAINLRQYHDPQGSRSTDMQAIKDSFHQAAVWQQMQKMEEKK